MISLYKYSYVVYSTRNGQFPHQQRSIPIVLLLYDSIAIVYSGVRCSPAIVYISSAIIHEKYQTLTNEFTCATGYVAQ
jgi:hypothetical protein